MKYNKKFFTKENLQDILKTIVIRKKKPLITSILQHVSK